MEKLVRDLQPGDKVRDAVGDFLTVKQITKGFAAGTRLIDWKEQITPNWSCLHNSETVEVQ